MAWICGGFVCIEEQITITITIPTATWRIMTLTVSLHCSSQPKHLSICLTIRCRSNQFCICTMTTFNFFWTVMSCLRSNWTQQKKEKEQHTLALEVLYRHFLSLVLLVNFNFKLHRRIVLTPASVDFHFTVLDFCT